MSTMEQKFTETLEKVKKNCSAFEVFPGYFDFKKNETFLTVDKSGISRSSGRILEIGCGSGFQSVLLSNCCGRITATDLPNFSSATHGVAIKNAKKLALSAGVENIDHVGCSAVDLPFRDESFDYVFSSGVLEHIHDRKAALTEMKRVLKNGGSAISTVPTYAGSLIEIPSLYFYAAKRLCGIISRKIFRKKPELKSIFSTGENNPKKIARNIKDCLLPKPHGDWRDHRGEQSIFVEIRKEMPWEWKALFEKSGFRVRKTFGVLFLPYRMIEIVNPKLLSRIYVGTRLFREKISESFLKYFAVCICFVARKES